VRSSLKMHPMGGAESTPGRQVVEIEGVPRLILPIYYVTCDQLDSNFPKNIDSIADVL